MSNVSHAGAFLIEAIFGLFLYAVLIRFWMQWVRADFRNPIGQMVITLTNPVVVPLRRILPPIGMIDLATVIVALLVVALKYFLIIQVQQPGTVPPLLALIIVSLRDLVRYSIYIFIAAILIQVISSWINPQGYNPIVALAASIANPLLRPVRQLLPSFSGIDFSPIVVLLFLQMTLILIS